MSRAEPQKPNYLKEFMTQGWVVNGGLISLIIGFLLSFVGGMAIIIAPLLLFLVTVAVLAMFMVDSVVFREKVDRGHRAQVREHTREVLYDRLVENCRSYSAGNWNRNNNTYQAMVRKVQDIATLDSDEVTLSETDVDRLKGVTIDYLRLWYAHDMIRIRMRTDTSTIQERIKSLNQQIKATENVTDRRALETVRDELSTSLESRARLPAKEAAYDARLIALGEAFDDLIHRITLNPAQSVSDFLAEANSKLSLEEEINASVDAELASLRPKAAAVMSRRATT